MRLKDRIRAFSIVFGLAATVLLGAPFPAAMGADAADLAAYKAAFETMRQDPGNSDKALAYAQAAIKVGDLEGAIGALERLLIFNPDLPRIRLELGVLYFRLGSYDLARSYLSDLSQRADLPPDIRQKVAEYQGQIDRQSSQHRVSGQLLAGLRHQSNANAASVNGNTRIFGIDLTLPQNLRKQHDLNFFGAGALNYVYDFQTMDQITLEANLNTYGAKQFRQSQFDLSLMQIDVGPRFGLGRLLEGASVRPYVIGDYLSLGGTSFLNSYGGGVNLLTPVMEKLAIETNVEIQNRQYWEDVARPRIEGRNGNFIAIRTTPRYALAENQVISLIGGYDRALAVQGYERYTQYLISPIYLIRFDSPVGFLDQPWTGTLGFSRIWRSYAQPDLLVDPDTTRNDREWSVSGTMTIGLLERVSAFLQMQHTWVDSTLPNFRYNNTIATVALALQF